MATWPSGTPTSSSLTSSRALGTLRSRRITARTGTRPRSVRRVRARPNPPCVSGLRCGSTDTDLPTTIRRAKRADRELDDGPGQGQAREGQAGRVGPARGRRRQAADAGGEDGARAREVGPRAGAHHQGSAEDKSVPQTASLEEGRALTDDNILRSLILPASSRAARQGTADRGRQLSAPDRRRRKDAGVGAGSRLVQDAGAGRGLGRGAPTREAQGQHVRGLDEPDGRQGRAPQWPGDAVALRLHGRPAQYVLRPCCRSSMPSRRSN